MSKSIEAIRAALAKYDAVLKSDTSSADECVAAMRRFERSILPMDVEHLLAELEAALSRASEVEALRVLAVEQAETLLRQRDHWQQRAIDIPGEVIERCANEAAQFAIFSPLAREIAAAIRSMRPTGDSGVQS